MRNVCVGVVTLAAALFLFQGAVERSAFAQGKKDTTKKTEAGAVEIKEGKDGKFRFTVRDAAGKLVAQSALTGFETVKDAQKAVDDLKSVLATAKVSVAKKEDEKKKEDK